MNPNPTIGVIGGSGFYDFLQNTRLLNIQTRWGKPSSPITLAQSSQQTIAFLPRHGAKHQFPPHKIPFRANIAALKKIGVKYILAPSSCGSLKPRIKPGHFVFPDQFVNFTQNRGDSFFNGPKTVHLSSTEPYCLSLRQLAVKTAVKLDIKAHPQGTATVIQGPRFASKAESKWYSKQGWDIINMTQYPENVLARELEMCYLNISLVTDFDNGLENHPEIKAVTADEIVQVFNQNLTKVKKLLLKIIEQIPRVESTCSCQKALASAVISS